MRGEIARDRKCVMCDERVPLSDVTNNNITKMRSRASKKPKALLSNEDLVRYITVRPRKQLTSTGDLDPKVAQFPKLSPSKQAATMKKRAKQNKRLVISENEHQETNIVTSPAQIKCLRIQLCRYDCQIMATNQENKNTFGGKSSVVDSHNLFTGSGKVAYSRVKSVGSDEDVKNNATSNTSFESCFEESHDSKNNSNVENKPGKSDRRYKNKRKREQSKVSVVKRNRKAATAHTAYKKRGNKIIAPSNNNNSVAESDMLPNYSNNLAVDLDPKSNSSPKESNKSCISTVKMLFIPLKNNSSISTKEAGKNKNINSRQQTSKENRKGAPTKTIDNVPNSSAANEVCTTVLPNKQSVPEKSAPCTPLVARLRKCDKKNYAELSPGSSVCEFGSDKGLAPGITNRNRKVPIYKQIPIVNERKQKKDLYEFDEFDAVSENKNKEKRDSLKYDRSMHEILQRLEKNENKQHRKKKTEKPFLSPKKSRKKALHLRPKYKEEVNKVIGKVLDKIKSKNAVLGKQRVDLHKPQENPGNEVNVGCADKTKFKKFSSEDNHTANQSLQKINIISQLQIVSPRFEDDHCDRDDDSQFGDHSDDSPFLGFSRSEVCNSPSNNSVSNFFGFSDSPPKAGVNSNRQLDKSVALEMFTPRRCNANSTMLSNRNLPWRTVRGKGNSYFIQVKRNALPCLNQEPVIEHSFVEPIEKRCSGFSYSIDITKNQRQTSMLDFVQSSVQSAAQIDQVVQPSLYDYEEFNDKPVNRRVLGVLQTNQLISTPKKDMAVKVASPDISLINSSDDTPFLGFDNSVDTDKENINIRNANPKCRIRTTDDNETYFGFETTSIENVKHSRQTNDKPFRVNVRFKYLVQENAGNDKINTAVNESGATSVVYNQGVQVEENNQDVHIFDDPETELDNVDMSITIVSMLFKLVCLIIICEFATHILIIIFLLFL